MTASFDEEIRAGEPYNPWKRFHGSFVPNWLLRRSEVTPGAKLCFARLTQYAGMNGECYPNIDTLAEEIGLSRRQTDRYLAELKRFNLIRAERKGFGRTNRYTFLWHAWAEVDLKKARRKRAGQPATEQSQGT